ncbi:hypothetical protein MNBD_GAMMA01-845 [hydrothermal vent metagenome]|uniref:Toxin n=1 Tax=hydrothermal vent metagenome TaxID=652676 RepID=A0A3B0UVG1_9ZZZZ
MTQYVLSPEAKKSLIQIKAFSTNQFGRLRATRYLQDIASRFKELASNPELGKLRNELKAGYYSYFVGSHSIYYRIKTNHIEIIDVLHQSMEPERHLS